MNTKFRSKNRGTEYNGNPGVGRRRISAKMDLAGARRSINSALGQDRVEWRAVVHMAMTFQVA
jgi:hypothetical protein